LFAVTASPIWTMKDGSTIPAGFWAEEVADPYLVLTDAGISVTFGTPGGKPASLQHYSLDEGMTGSSERSEDLRRELSGIEAALAHPLSLDDLDGDDFDAIYIPGGTGPMEDLYNNPALGRILTSLQARSSFISAACHGTIALLSARDESDHWIFSGYEMTGYTNEEEQQGGPGDAAPFTLETRLRQEGARYVSGAAWTPFVITDRNVITGQNPASAAEVARQLVSSLS
jgi:putative intracellular protease/amidase